jgi:hypothetical protein
VVPISAANCWTRSEEHDHDHGEHTDDGQRLKCSDGPSSVILSAQKAPCLQLGVIIIIQPIADFGWNTLMVAFIE